MEALREGVTMSRLGEWVQILDSDGKPHSVTRQAVDMMLAKYEGRVRPTRVTRAQRLRAETNGNEQTGIDLSAFE